MTGGEFHTETHVVPESSRILHVEARRVVQHGRPPDLPIGLCLIRRAGVARGNVGSYPITDYASGDIGKQALAKQVIPADRSQSVLPAELQVHLHSRRIIRRFALPEHEGILTQVAAKVYPISSRNDVVRLEIQVLKVRRIPPALWLKPPQNLVEKGAPPGKR